MCATDESCLAWVTFDKTGEHLTVGLTDGSRWRWTVATQALANLVCERVWRELTPDEWRLFVGNGKEASEPCGDHAREARS